MALRLALVLAVAAALVARPEPRRVRDAAAPVATSPVVNARAIAPVVPSLELEPNTGPPPTPPPEIAPPKDPAHWEW